MSRADIESVSKSYPAMNQEMCIVKKNIILGYQRTPLSTNIPEPLMHKKHRFFLSIMSASYEGYLSRKVETLFSFIEARMKSPKDFEEKIRFYLCYFTLHFPLYLAYIRSGIFYANDSSNSRQFMNQRLIFFTSRAGSSSKAFSLRVFGMEFLTQLESNMFHGISVPRTVSPVTPPSIP